MTEPAATEEWRPVVGAEEWYDVSSHGRVRSWHQYGGRLPEVRVRAAVPRITKPYVRPDGHIQVAINTVKRMRPRKAHRLVAAAFLGEEPPGMEVCHNDGDPANNHVSNLRYGTRAENIADRYKHGWVNRGEAHGANKLTEPDVLEIKRLLAEGKLFQREIGAKFGVSQAAIGKIAANKMWQWLEAA